RLPAVLERRRHADLGARVPAALRGDGGVRPADLAAPVSWRRHDGLQGGRSVAVRDLVDVRLALRYERGDGAPGLRRPFRSVPVVEDHRPSHGRDGAVLRGTGRPRVGPARRADLRRGLLAGAEVAEEAPARLLQDVLRRYGALRRVRRDRVWPRVLRRRSGAL